MDKVDLKDKKVLLDILDTVDSMFDSTEKTVKKYVQDKSIDLEDRWEVFCRAGNLGLLGLETVMFRPKGIDWNEINLFDNFYVNKYEQYTTLSLLTKAIDDEIPINEEEYKESCMQEFVFEAINDW